MHTDAELLSEFTRTRSEQAFRGLVERYGGTVHSICYRRLRDPHLAEDAAQMVFATLARKAESVAPDMVGPWLYQTAHFVANGAARKRDRHKKRDVRAGMERRRSYEPVDTGALEDLVDSHLAKLEDKYRDALVLRYIQERSLPEVAEALRISQEAAKKRLLRGLGRLRKLMADGGVVAGAALVESALSRIGHGHPPEGFVDRLVENLGKKGSFVKGENSPPTPPFTKRPLLISATTVVTLIGALTVWWINSPPNRVVVVGPPANSGKPDPAQRLNKKFAPFESSGNLQGAIEMLKERTNETFDVRWDVLRENGVTPDTPLIGQFFDVNLGQALDLLCHSLPPGGAQLKYVVEADRIVITVAPPSPVSG